VHGGLYLDNDAHLRRPLTGKEWLDPRGVWVFEKKVHVSALSRRERANPASERVGNYAFGSAQPRCQALRRVIEECITRIKLLLEENLERWNDSEVLWVCGPDVLSAICNKNPELFSPRLKDFCTHRGAGTWRDESDNRQ